MTIQQLRVNNLIIEENEKFNLIRLKQKASNGYYAVISIEKENLKQLIEELQKLI